MAKHSKNNTASSIFSYAEYKKLDYGTKRQRLGRESMRNFNACALCLQKARNPVACSHGHLFCKECIYTDLLTQKKDIKVQKAKLEAWKREQEEEKQRARAQARERVLEEFERGQLTLAARSAAQASSSASSNNENKEATNSQSRGTKRKFEFSPGHVERLAEEAEAAAMKKIKLEQAEAMKAKLPDFWLPSLLPTYTRNGLPQDLKDIKVQTVCKGGQEVHEISLKTLTPVTFTLHNENGGKNEEEAEPLCPSCKKELSNSSLMFLITACSHVVCKTCADTIVRPALQCVVCDKELKKTDLLELQREGTGFAGGGLAETSKTGIAFQG